MLQEIKVRYNTEKDKSDSSLPAWRVLINGVEHLAETVNISTPSWTTQDQVAPGLLKWHISCLGTATWNGLQCSIQPSISASCSGGVIWLTGLSAAGKSTIAAELAKSLRSLNLKVEELDGDAIREVFPSTGFSRTDRDQHIRRVGYLASRLEAQGVVVVASLISPYEDSRLFVRNLCKNYFEVFVDTPLEVCEARDPKGLYKKARAGLISSMTGLDDPYETPSQPHIIVNTTELNPREACEKIFTAFMRESIENPDK